MRRFALVLLICILGLLSFYSYQKYRNLPHPKEPAPAPRNVYVITASGLRADHISSYMYQPIQTPAIDFLAYDGIRFTNAFTTSTESMSAHLSILTGIYPFHEPIKQAADYLLDLGKHPFPTNLLTLPDILAKKGYRTAAFLSDPELRFPAYFGSIFHEAFTGDRFLYPWHSSYSTSTICKLARQWIQQHSSTPHFVLLNFHEPTFPFQPPAPYDRQYTNYPYDGEVAGVDEQIGLFVNLLKESGLFQHSIVILTAPFGETLADSSRYSSPANAVLHVPLLIAAPGLLPRHSNYEAQVSLIDVLPTVMALLQYSIDSKLDGLSLFKKSETAQISREFIFGTVPFRRWMGFQPQFFARTSKYLATIGSNESARPNGSYEVSESQQKEWIEQAQKQLNNQGIRSGPRDAATIGTDPAALLEKVIELARLHQPEIALDLLRLFDVPQNSVLENLQGMLLLASDVPEDAMVAFRRAVQLSPTPKPLPGLARAALAAEKPHEALEALRQYQRSVSNMSYDTRSSFGVALFKAGKEQEALLQFNTVLRQNPRYSEAYLYRGKVWKKLGHKKEAEEDLKMAIEAQSDYVDAYHELASLLEESGRPTDAIPYLRQLLKFEPTNYRAMFQLAVLHQKSGHQTEARKLGQQVILYAPDEELKLEARKLFAGASASPH
jgi:tetratricopeptide (TPR) repeat protein